MANPICPTDCTTNLPIFRFPDCGTGGLDSQSEIQRVFFGKANRTPFTNVYSEAEWIAVLDNTGDNDTDQTIRGLDVIGDMPAATPVIKTFSKGRTQVITKNRTLNFTIDLISDETWTGARELECGGQFRWWFETKGAKMYGGNRGFLANIDINPVLARGDDGSEELQAVLTWQAKFMPERGVSPIFQGETTNDDDEEEVPDITDFDNVVAFDTSTSGVATTGAKNGLTFAVSATNANQKVAYDTVANSGGPLQINIQENGVTKVSIGGFGGLVTSGNSVYYQDTLGNPHTHVWAATINFTV